MRSNSRMQRRSAARPAGEPERHADKTMKIRLLVLASVISCALEVGCCGRHEGRAYFAKGHGIGITDPIPDNDGTWWMAVQHETLIQHSGQFVQRWDATVRDDTIELQALVVSSGPISRWWHGPPESGAHIHTLQQGDYTVVYLERDGSKVPLGRVTARRSDRLPKQKWRWS